MPLENGPSAPVLLPDVTLIIEWENAIDVVDEWTDRAMAGLARELASVGPRLASPPRVMYLYDRNAVAEGAIPSVIDRVAPELRDVADLQIVPTEGLSYYKLKNFGVARSRTELTVMLDSDAVPQPGWLEALIAPFEDSSIMAVGGFTRLGYDSFLSRAMALSWIFDLEDEGAKTARKMSLHVNNCAVRSDFFRDHPFQDLPSFKKQCVFWLRGILNEGHGYVRSAGAKAVHAPHPGVKFLFWRAWTAGRDADFVAAKTKGDGMGTRLAAIVPHFAKRVWRAWKRIVRKGDVVGMPAWQRPFALLVPLFYYGLAAIAQTSSALTRRFGPLPPFRPMPFVER